MPVRVSLHPRDLRTARRLASDRNKSFEANEAWDNDKKSWGVDPEDRNYLGLIGEWAFAEYADLTIDTSEHRWSDGGGDFDVEINGEPVSVDVKTSAKEPKALMVKEWRVDADYYVLAHPEDRDVILYGGAWRDQVVAGPQKESPYGHVNYTLGVEYLEELPAPDEIIEVDPT